MKVLENNGLLIVFLFMAMMLTLRGLTLKDTKPEDEVKKGFMSFKGQIFEVFEQDSVTYDQHPQTKCMRNTWQKH